MFLEKLRAAATLGEKFKIDSPGRLPGFRSGTHRGLDLGSSLDFQDFRPYHPGDDIRKINWNAYARSGQLVVTCYRQEIEPTVDIFIDDSPSMNLTGAKRESTLFLTRFLEMIYRRSGFSVTLFLGKKKLSSGGLENSCDPDCFRSVAWHLDLADLVRQPYISPGPAVLITDLLFEVRPADFLHRIQGKKRNLALFQLTAREEESPEQGGYRELVDLEGAGILPVFLAGSTLDGYKRKFLGLRELYRELCFRRAVPFFCHDTGRDLKSLARDQLIPASFLRAV